jgi:hypothetical protein
MDLTSIMISVHYDHRNLRVQFHIIPLVSFIRLISTNNVDFYSRVRTLHLSWAEHVVATYIWPTDVRTKCGSTYARLSSSSMLLKLKKA